MIRTLKSLVAGFRRRSLIDPRAVLAEESAPPCPYFQGSSKPYTRWWWTVGPFHREDIRFQLEWVRANGFGGVELAWLWPSWTDRGEPGIAWLGPEWSERVAFTKQEADRLGRGCDFTFGSCWPFGGSSVSPDDALRTFTGLSRRRLTGSWEQDDWSPPHILNHLDRGALRRYAEAMLPAFEGALRGSSSALFCDSLEIDTRPLWDPKLWDRFAERFDYRLEPLLDQIDDDPALRYDVRTMIADAILREFYEEFAAICRENGAMSRVQCHGAPTDLLSAYAAVDIPESESLLFNPSFSRISASAAALAGKPVVSAETFTCIYGFGSRTNFGPLRVWKREQVADLKLLADALFAQGVNQIVWHGMPFNGPGGRNEFYASVHVGPDSAFAAELPAFNAYLERVSALLKLGRPESRLAIYLPNEDNRRLDLLPDEDRTPGAVHHWEMRRVAVSRETEGYAPLWISPAFLARGGVEGGRLRVGEVTFSALLVDVDWLDGETLPELLRLADAGLPIILPRTPRSPGRSRRGDYDSLVEALRGHPGVVSLLADAALKPLVNGHDLPPFWARRTAGSLLLFFAHPRGRDVRYPMSHGQSLCRERWTSSITIDFEGTAYPVNLSFEPYQSLFVRVSRAAGVQFVAIAYLPPEPTVTTSRVPDERELPPRDPV